MWDMYLHYEDYLPFSRHTADVIADEYTWDHTADKLINAMGGRAALDAPDLHERDWFQPTIQEFYIVTNKDCKYEINGIVYDFKKGETYYEFGDLKRMMFENDNLDPVCLGDPSESGLTPEQQQKVPHYEARHSRCYTCGQKLNSDLTLDFDDE